jgi:hypothetical protein
MANAVKAQTSKPAPKPETTVGNDRVWFDGNYILAGVFSDYQKVVEKIREHNDKYSGKVIDENAYTPSKAMREAKDARESDNRAEALLSAWEAANDAVADAKLAIARYMSDKTGKSLAADLAKPDDEELKALREDRRHAVALATSLATLADFTRNESAKSEVTDALEAFPLPSIGGSADATSGWVATRENASTPKYRTIVTATVNGTEKFKVNGFTAATNSARSLHSRANGPAAKDFRKAWEDAGNRPGKTVQSVVTFTHENVTYAITEAPKKS